MKKKKQISRKKLKKVASQLQEKVNPSPSSSGRLRYAIYTSTNGNTFGPSLPLMALSKAMVPLLGDHNILITMEDATF